MRTSVTHLIEKVTKTRLTFAATGQTKTFTFTKPGFLRYIVSEASDPTTGSLTYTISIANADGTVIYTSGNLAHNAATTTAISSVPLTDELHTVTVTLSDVAGEAGMTVDVTLIVER
jgi:hypothetical protein